MSDKPSPFQQQFNIKSASGSSIIFGLGNMARTNFSLQVTGNDGTWLASQSAANNPVLSTGVNAGVPVTPTSWDVWLQGINDLMTGVGPNNGGGTKLCEHSNTTPNVNGDVVSNEGPPIDSLQVVWNNVVLGTADNLLVTITAV